MWKSTKVNNTYTSTGLKVSMELSQMLSIDWLYNSDSFSTEFKQRINPIRTKNNSALDFFKPKIVDENNLEIWQYNYMGDPVKVLYKLKKLKSKK